jgi:hypothetical protein
VLPAWAAPVISITPANTFAEFKSMFNLLGIEQLLNGP